MFERFTERARKVVVHAQDEARRLRHAYIGTEHLLLGLLREKDGVAAQALRAVGITPENVREHVEGIAGYGEDDTGSQAPFTQPTKTVMERALGESLQLEHDYIGTEHLLPGLLRDSIAAQALGALGVRLDEAREQVESIVGFGEENSDARAPLIPRSKKVLQLAGREARQLDDHHVWGEHILLGLAREGEGR